MLLCAFLRSLPLRECGLKSCFGLRKSVGKTVTPLAGVWIEIEVGGACTGGSGTRHSPCGSVD